MSARLGVVIDQKNLAILNDMMIVRIADDSDLVDRCSPRPLKRRRRPVKHRGFTQPKLRGFVRADMLVHLNKTNDRFWTIVVTDEHARSLPLANSYVVRVDMIDDRIVRGPVNALIGFFWRPELPLW